MCTCTCYMSQICAIIILFLLRGDQNYILGLCCWNCKKEYKLPFSSKKYSPSLPQTHYSYSLLALPWSPHPALPRSPHPALPRSPSLHYPGHHHCTTPSPYTALPCCNLSLHYPGHLSPHYPVVSLHCTTVVTQHWTTPVTQHYC